MLKLENIVKIYDPGVNDIVALDGVSIDFRKSEFVSILGPSGCGKTTLLNVIGGLDSYTSGDLYINGKSTKDFKDRDWDNYRNHSIGFVFQSYNLIPHQTILKNVELALTLSGVNAKERRERAIEALHQVGLESKINKKPNQLSGGQMQRVAIARSLVNNPSILLADEPTGALDTTTSVQIMDILKKVSEDRLVIMVTHNPELAETYSTRIIKVIDGKVTDDSNPYQFNLSDEVNEESLIDKKDKQAVKELKKKQKKDNKKTSMNFLTALSLSFNNMITKKARTILTAFAGSIGIIGIALILSLSSGFKEYINQIERNTLSTYPLTVYESNIDTTSMLTSMMDVGEEEIPDQEEGKIYSSSMLTNIVDTLIKSYKPNDLTAFKKYIEENKEEFTELGIVKYSYGTNFFVYPSNYDENTNLVNDQVNNYSFSSHLSESYGQLKDTPGITSAEDIKGIDMLYQSMPIWSEMLSQENKGTYDYTLVKSQYDLVAGCWPDEVTDGSNRYANVVLRLDKNYTLPDYVLYSLGLADPNEVLDTIIKYFTTQEIVKPEAKSYDYNDLLNMTFKLAILTDIYKDKGDGSFGTLETGAETKAMLDNALTIKICGIIIENNNAKASSLSGYIGYMSELNNYVINKTNNSPIVQAQRLDEEIDITTGLPFESNKSVQDNYDAFGVVDYNTPSYISFYPSSFENKEKIIDLIDEYNSQFEKDSDKISYTDYVGLIMESVGTIIDAITYVLIAFVSISLVVSSIMIGIITYISVLERTKEIGILRAIGASKRDISRVFNAETIILGFFAGLIGIFVTMLLNIPINLIIYALAEIEDVAALPWWGAIGLVSISVLLTLIAGTIPSGIASKKDPVVALRTE